MAGLLKCVLALQHGEIPASLHLKEPNPEIPWDRLPFDIPRERTSWPANGRPRLAGVSAFGITGTNAHVVLQEAPSPEPRETLDTLPGASPQLLILSAVTPAALKQVAALYADRLERTPDLSLADVCATAARHRAALEYRAAFVADDAGGMAERLRRFAAGDAGAADITGRGGDAVRRIAFVFPGQGGQWVGMTRELLDHHPVFRQALERCDAAVPRDAGFSIVEQLQLDPASPRYRLQEIGVIQPTLLAVEIALAELWRSWGITPDAVVGHSMGEVAAAHAAGSLSLADAMRVICRRSALLQRTSGHGAMALVALDLEQTTRRVADRAELVSVAASNGPRSTVVSGDPAAITALLVDLERDGIFCRAVQVDVASHSPQMDPLVPELVDSLASLATSPASTAHYSTVYGRQLADGECGPDYWGRNLRQPVLFAQAVEQVLGQGIDTAIEMGPHPTLLASVAEVGSGSAPPLTLHSLRRNEPERASLLISLGALWASGHPVSWGALFRSGTYTRVALPHYPWQRERHWPDDAMSVQNDPNRRRVRLDDTARSWLYVPNWERLARATSTTAPRHWLVVTNSAFDAEELIDALATAGSTAEHVRSRERAIGRIRTGISGGPAESRHRRRCGRRGDRTGVRCRLAAEGSAASLGRADEYPGSANLVGHARRATAAERARFDRRRRPFRAMGCRARRRHRAPRLVGWAGRPRRRAAARPPGPTCSPAICPAPPKIRSQFEAPIDTRSGIVKVTVTVSRDRALLAGAPTRAYLITGGLGGVALEIAKAMVRDGARRLVLLGRSPLPPRSAWAGIPDTTAVGRRSQRCVHWSMRVHPCICFRLTSRTRSSCEPRSLRIATKDGQRSAASSMQPRCWTVT